MIDINAKFLTIEEVLKIAKVSRITLHRDIKAGKVSAVYVGRQVRIKESDAIEYAKKKGKSTRVAYYKEKDE